MLRRVCRACGAELRLEPQSCPLCGSAVSARARRSRDSSRDVDVYQRRVQRLKEELRKLRRDAEAV